MRSEYLAVKCNEQENAIKKFDISFSIGCNPQFVEPIHSKHIVTSLMAMKTTTKSGKNQKFSRKVPEEKVEAI